MLPPAEKWRAQAQICPRLRRRPGLSCPELGSRETGRRRDRGPHGHAGAGAVRPSSANKIRKPSPSARRTTCASVIRRKFTKKNGKEVTKAPKIPEIDHADHAPAQARHEAQEDGPGGQGQEGRRGAPRPDAQASTSRPRASRRSAVSKRRSSRRSKAEGPRCVGWHAKLRRGVPRPIPPGPPSLSRSG